MPCSTAHRFAQSGSIAARHRHRHRHRCCCCCCCCCCHSCCCCCCAGKVPVQRPKGEPAMTADSIHVDSNGVASSPAVVACGPPSGRRVRPPGRERPQRRAATGPGYYSGDTPAHAAHVTVPCAVLVRRAGPTCWPLVVTAGAGHAGSSRAGSGRWGWLLGLVAGAGRWGWSLGLALSDDWRYRC